MRPTTTAPTAAAPNLNLWPSRLRGGLLAEQAKVVGGAHPLCQAVDCPREVLTGPLDLRDQDVRVSRRDGALDRHRPVDLHCAARFRH